MAEVTTGNQLNQYTGNAGLAGGAGGQVEGVSESSFSPLENYAIRKFQTSLIDYQTQEQDRAKLEAQFADPNIHVPLDEDYAMQIRPQMEQFKDLMAKNPSAYKDPKTWYKIQKLDQDLIQNNARLKAVQTLKDQYKTLAGSEPNESKKKNYESYISELNNYKLGEDVPKFNDYFTFDAKHLPTLDVISSPAKERINGNNVETVKRTVTNPLGLYEKAKEQHLSNADVNNTGTDLAKMLLSHGGLEDLNKKMAQKYDDALKLNFRLLNEKYADEFEEYKKKNKGAGMADFLNATGKTGELKKIEEGLSFLKQPLDYVHDNAADDPQLNHAFTYDTNGIRLNADNDKLRAIYKTLESNIGVSEEVTSKLSKLPAEVNLIKAKIAKTNTDAAVNKKKAADQGALIRAKIKKLEGNPQEQETAFNQYWDDNFKQQQDVAVILNVPGDKPRVNSIIPFNSSLPIYTVDGKRLKPQGGTPVYNAYKPDGTPAKGAKIVDYKDGYYNINYTVRGTNTKLTDDALISGYDAYKKAGNKDASFSDFVKEMFNSGKLDYVVEGQGRVDRERALSAQKAQSNKATKKDQEGIYEYDESDLIPTDNE